MIEVAGIEAEKGFEDLVSLVGMTENIVGTDTFDQPHGDQKEM